MRRLSAAISFLSRVPMPQPSGRESIEVGRATIFFPLVGAAIGACGWLALRLSFWFPAPLIALLVVAFWALVTGAMHLDGLADTADGLGGGRTREEKLEIMRDPRVGTYGVVALVLALAMKVTALSTLVSRGVAAPYLIVAPSLGRWVTVPLGHLLPYARRETHGLGTALTGYAGKWEVLGATVIAAAITYLVAGPDGFLGWGVVVGIAAILGAWFKHSLGGVTGDTLGAACEICETAVLVFAVALTR